MIELKETVFETDSDNKFATITTNERKWITKLNKLAEKRPDEVKIVSRPEDNHGYMLAHVPKSYMKLSPPRTVNYSEEHRAALADRMKTVSRKKKEV